jgi:hypothetical protein
VVRFDNYRIDLEKRVIHLGYWNLRHTLHG